MESTRIYFSAVINSEFEDLDFIFYLIRVPKSSLICAGKLRVYAKGICNVVFIPTTFFLPALVDILTNNIILRC
jgi:hypothetical protein